MSAVVCCPIRRRPRSCANVVSDSCHMMSFSSKTLKLDIHSSARQRIQLSVPCGVISWMPKFPVGHLHDSTDKMAFANARSTSAKDMEWRSLLTVLACSAPIQDELKQLLLPRIQWACHFQELTVTHSRNGFNTDNACWCSSSSSVGKCGLQNLAFCTVNECLWKSSFVSTLSLLLACLRCKIIPGVQRRAILQELIRSL